MLENVAKITRVVLACGTVDLRSNVAALPPYGCGVPLAGALLLGMTIP